MADKKISALTSATTPLAGTEVLPIVQGGSTVKVAVSDLTAGRAVGANGLTSTANVRVQYSAAGNVSSVVNNTSAAAGSISQLITTNDASRSLRIQYASSGGAAGSGITNGFTTEVGQIFTDGNFPIVLGTNVSAALILDTSQNAKIINNLIVGTAGKGIDFSANTHAAGMTSELLNWYEEGTWTPTQGAGLTVVGAFSSRGHYTRVGRLVQVSGTVLGATSVAVTAGTILCGGLPFASNGTQGSAGSMNNDSINVAGGVFTSINNLFATSSIAATAAIPFTVTYFI
jgi:hypothetical protein